MRGEDESWGVGRVSVADSEREDGYRRVEVRLCSGRVEQRDVMWGWQRWLQLGSGQLGATVRRLRRLRRLLLLGERPSRCFAATQLDTSRGADLRQQDNAVAFASKSSSTDSLPSALASSFRSS